MHALGGYYKDEKLAVPLKLQGSALEKRRLTHLVNQLAKSPLGKKQLENAAKEGFVLGFEFSPCAAGYCSSEDKIIRLNPVSRDSSLITTLAHESRHALQYTNGLPNEFLQHDVATELKLWRAAEADAEAASAYCALEIKAVTGDASAWHRVAESSHATRKGVAEILSGDESIEQLNKKQPQVMKTAFEAWFKNSRIVDAYEDGYLFSNLYEIISENPLDRKEDYQKYPMDKSLTSAQIVNKFCLMTDGTSYYKDNPDILEKDRNMNGITNETRSMANRFFALRQKETGKAPDNSYEDLPSRFTLSGLEMSQYKEAGNSFASKLNIIRNRRTQGR